MDKNSYLEKVKALVEQAEKDGDVSAGEFGQNPTAKAGGLQFQTPIPWVDRNRPSDERPVPR
jgi:hypothetical protein